MRKRVSGLPPFLHREQKLLTPQLRESAHRFNGLHAGFSRRYRISESIGLMKEDDYIGGSYESFP
jgi:hypothetical protein